ncbi:zinc finger BED domain-containing protein 1-like [Rhizophagus irregularis DAOM 181602=DAOM 197198]|nr:zinc finger BED domain-containing protein 1-like [Rhizophagus irregularis DAOM 181602=DAOM 197198]
MSETDSTVTHSSTFSNDRRKRKRNATSPEIAKPIDRTNKSHTTYFFRKDTDDNEIAYCILCERKLAANRKPYPYSRKGGSTSNLAVHLRDKHGPKENDAQITNYRCSETRQQELMRLLIIFIIKFVQPLYILQNDAFRNFVHSCEPGFQIPCEKTAKNLIHEAYIWSKDQLLNLLGSTIMSVHLTTDLWTARSKHGYIGVTATWLSSDFTFYEVLLTCSHLEYPHTGETISDELYRIIDQWRLKNTIFKISTDNGSNMVKAVSTLGKSLPGIKRHPCAVHTLQLSVKQELKHYVSIIEESQIQTSPLDVLSDTKTRWNSTLIAWKRVLELHNAMRYVATKLLSERDRILNKEGEKLESLCLTHDEKMQVKFKIILICIF